MSDTNPVKANATLTPEVIKSKFDVALKKAQIGIQELINREAKLVYNEDNLEEIAKFIELGKKAKKIVEDQYTVIKAPVLRDYQNIDAGKREVILQISTPLTRAHEKYTALCKSVQERKKKAQGEKTRIDNIKKSIDSDVLVYTQKIAGATTSEDLNKIQQSINLAKGAKQGAARYQEFHPEMISKLEGLNASINEQKIKIKKLETLKAKEVSADENEQEEIKQEIQQVQSSIEESGILLQEIAIQQVTTPSYHAQEIFAEVKPKRSVWKWRVVDINIMAKKMPHLVQVVPCDDKIDDLLKSKKTDKSLEGSESHIVNGLEFYLEKTF